MTTYYVDFVNGLDANNGLGPDASHASNKPWKTLGKLLGAAGFASGDTAYLSPAGPFREVVTVAMTSAVAETTIIGDVANAQGFKTSAGVLVTPGEVQWTAYTTNDKTAPSASATLNLSARDFLTFRRIVFVGGSAQCVTASTATSTDITFTECAFNSVRGTNALQLTIGFGIAGNWLLDRCWITTLPANACVQMSLVTGVGSDYDANVLFRNCTFVDGSNAVNVLSSGTSAQEGGGVDLLNCTQVGGGSLLSTAGSTRIGGSAFAFPCTAYNNLSIGQSNLWAGESGAIVEDYNLLYGGTTHTNVTPGAHTVADSSYAPLYNFGQERIFGARIRPFGMPALGSPWLGFGGSSPPSVDILSAPRPSGGASASTAVGAFERSDTFTRETTTTRTGVNAISITGPGYQDFDLPVSAASTTVTVYVRWDATYAGTKPKMQVLNGSEAGVTDATATATGSSGAWEQLSLNFTPTSTGIVTIRLLSSDTNGGGKMFADDFAVT